MAQQLAIKPLSISQLVEAGQEARQAESQSPPTLTVSKNWTLPPKTKPGRKPIADDSPCTKRRLQNREAQRAFRQRRTDRLQDLEAQVFKLLQEKDQMETHLQSIIQKLRQENNSLKRQLKEVAGTSISDIPASQKTDFECGVCIKDDCLCESVGMEKKDSRAELEIDFTTKFASTAKQTVPETKCDLCEDTVCVCQEAVALANLCQTPHDK